MLAGIQDIADIFAVFIVDGTKGFQTDNLSKTDDGIERCAEFMAHVREEVILCLCRLQSFLRGYFKLDVLFGDFINGAL